jgi:hypothetical protein
MNDAALAKTVELLKAGNTARLRGEALYVDCYGEQASMVFLAKLYAELRALGKVKIVFQTKAAEIKFFDKTVPENTELVDLFAVLDNQSMQFDEARVILLPNTAAVDAEQLKAIGKAVQSSKSAVVAFVADAKEAAAPMGPFGALQPHTLSERLVK